MLEDSGQENWDEALYQRFTDEYAQNGGEEKQTPMTERDIQLAHSQLIYTYRVIYIYDFKDDYIVFWFSTSIEISWIQLCATQY